MFPGKFARGTGGLRGAQFAGMAAGGGGAEVVVQRANMGVSRTARSLYAGRRKYPAGSRKYSRSYPKALSFQGIETKFFDTSNNGTGLTANTTWAGCELNPATVLCFNSMVQGSSASQREGRKITCLTLEITGTITVAAQTNVVAADVAPTICIALVRDKNTNGGSGTSPGLDAENVYTNPSAGTAGVVTPLRNMNFSKRYKVYKQLVFPLVAPTLTWDGTNMEQSGTTTPFKMFAKLNFVTEFSANAGTVADITDNGLFLIGVANNVELVPTINYNARLRYRG